MYWINRQFADGTESDYEHSSHYAYLGTARKAAIASTRGPEPGVEGGECYLISDGAVIEHYRDGELVDA